MAIKERVDEGGGGSGGGPRPPGPTPLPSPVSPRPVFTGNEEIQLLGPAELGQPIPLVYGRHLVAGKIFFQHVIQNGADAGKTLLFIELGEGEWDAVEALFVNNKLVDHTDTNLIHFHPGLNGEAGVESAPATRNQKTCSFWPTNLPELNFPNIAYVSFLLPPDFEAPSEEFFVIGIYRTLKVRIFNSSGTQTSYAYSTNPAWHALDKHIRTWIAAAKLNGETLSAAEKAKIDFSFFKTWADDCDFDIGSGVKRFEAHVALTQETDLMRALELSHLLGRAYTLELNGKIAPSMDKARSSLATVTSTDIAEGSLQLGRRSLREAANRFEASFRQLDSGNGAGTISTSGVTVTGSGSDFTKHFKPGEPCDLRSGAQAGEIQVVKSVSSDIAMTLESAFSTDQTSVSYGNPAQDFQVRTHVVEDTTLQSQVGRIITAKFDLGNTTLHQADRTMIFLEKRTTDLVRQVSFRLLMGQADALDLLPGDVITASDDIGLDPANTRDYEILEITLQPDGSVEIAAQEYQDVFSDSSSASQLQALALPPRARTGVAGGFQMGAVFVPDQLNGASDAGEIDFDPLPNQDHTFWRLPDGSLLSFPAGSQFVSQATLDSYTGDVFLIFSKQLCNSERGLAAFQDSHLLEVRHNAGQWQYDNNSAWVNFTPVASDIAIFRATRNGANWAGVPMEFLGVSLLSQRVLSTLVEYSDGTPIDDVQPAEAGANVTETRTSNNTSNVGASTAADTDTGASRARNALDSIFKLTTGTTLQTVAQIGDAHDRAVAGLTSIGDLARDIIASRKIVGRAEGLGTTLQHVNATGLLDFSQAHPSKGALATLSAAAWGSQVSGRPTELTDGRVAAGLDGIGDLLRNVKTGKVVEGSILAGALALAGMKSDSLARMFTADTKRTNVEGLESNGLVATTKFSQSVAGDRADTSVGGITSSGTFVSVGSVAFVKIPATGTFKATADDMTLLTGTSIAARVAVGANKGSTVTSVGQVSTITGLTPGSVVTVDVEVRSVNVDGTVRGKFRFRRDTPLHEEHWN